MLRLAARCDIRVPETRVERLGEESVLLLRRFDRQKVAGGYHRHHIASAFTLLDAADSPTDRTNWSYLLLADELQRWSSRPRQDKAELFLRVVFNALISNNDDHPRNHAVVAPAPIGLTLDVASGLIDRVAEIVRRYWQPDVFALGGTEADCAAIEPAFVHAGFEYAIGL